MCPMLTLRLEKELELALERAAASAGVSKSLLVRDCLAKYLADRASDNRAWELGQDVFGRHGSGRGDLSCRRKQILREKLNGRRRRG